MAGDLFSLWRSLEAKRRAEDSVVRLERRDFEREGLDWTKVAEARRQAANDRLQRAVAQRHALYPYQPSLPGINPTLMALRSRGRWVHRRPLPRVWPVSAGSAARSQWVSS